MKTLQIIKILWEILFMISIIVAIVGLIIIGTYLWLTPLWIFILGFISTILSSFSYCKIIKVDRKIDEITTYIYKHK